MRLDLRKVPFRYQQSNRLHVAGVRGEITKFVTSVEKGVSEQGAFQAGTDSFRSRSCRRCRGLCRRSLFPKSLSVMARNEPAWKPICEPFACCLESCSY